MVCIIGIFMALRLTPPLPPLHDHSMMLLLLFCETWYFSCKCMHGYTALLSLNVDVHGQGILLCMRECVEGLIPPTDIVCFLKVVGYVGIVV